MDYTIQRTITNNFSRVEKLPNWAKEHIRDLEKHASKCEQELKKLLDDQTESQVSYTSHALNIGDRRFIPCDSVRFRIGPRQEIEVRLEADHLHVMQTESIRGGLVIKPCVTNVIDIYPT